ncbi:MAG: flagellar biosynthetic protein FliO [candidate division WS1 bacterium]|jgi:flagellar biogenesis protein FliO|nr:flagellar biosynthetic protein FliO [candidate division WS1 bacterium]
MRAMSVVATLMALGAAPASAQRASAYDASPAALLAQALLSLAVVVGVIYLAYYGLRRVADRQVGADADGPMRIVQARHLGGDRWLYLVEVGGRRIIVGGAAGHIAPIAELGDAGSDGDGT